MADLDLTELVTIRKESTGEEREVPRGAVAYFPDFVELDAAGRKKAHQTSTTVKES